MKNFKKAIALLLLLLMFSIQSHALELVCKGYQQEDVEQRKVVLDCNSREETLGFLAASFQLIREKAYPSYMEDMCWQPYKNIKEYPPQSFGSGMAQSFINQCNQVLKNIP